MIRPVAIAICYGLLFATLLTLVFIPVIYTIRQDIANLIGRIFGRREDEKPGTDQVGQEA